MFIALKEGFVLSFNNKELKISQGSTYKRGPLHNFRMNSNGDDYYVSFDIRFKNYQFSFFFVVTDHDLESGELFGDIWDVYVYDIQKDTGVNIDAMLLLEYLLNKTVAETNLLIWREFFYNTPSFTS